MRRLRVLAFVLLTTIPAVAQAVYHERSCPSVDPQRMTRMKRYAAEASGLMPAPDCHPQTQGRYLGVSGAGVPSETSSERRIHVNGYTKQDGTVVREYWRPAPPPRTYERSRF